MTVPKKKQSADVLGVIDLCEEFFNKNPINNDFKYVGCFIEAKLIDRNIEFRR